ncbi:MAG: ABC transporter ATP-binding protein [Candidatus Odinarchaeota archaeon]|nr:ABC transporter ATP-binding protein [Candidatus Odinarchaeota archaeon]
MENGVVKAVDDVSFEIPTGKVVGLAGESGSGKTTIAMSIMRLLPSNGKIVDGEMILDDEIDLTKVDERYMREKIRWKKIAIIFQGAMNALNPVLNVGDQIVEAILAHENVSREEAWQRTKQLFEEVGLDPDRIRHYPHEFSGGMRQRVMIAMALACNPSLVIADEPTTALDVTIQAEIIDLLLDLQKAYNLSVLLISHDLSVMAQMSHHIAILYGGKLMEYGDAVSIFKKPRHPYTQGLISSLPSVSRTKKERKLVAIPGSPPDLLNPPAGCPFNPRCPIAKDICYKEMPTLEKVDGSYVACHFVDETKDRNIWRE